MKFIIIISAVLLSGCIEVTPKENSQTKALLQQTTCFDIIDSIGGQPEQAILINKCTGETWITLKSAFPLEEDEITPSFTYKWYRIHRYEKENSVAGRKK